MKMMVDILRYGPLKLWRPQVGDFIIYHGWLPWRRWFGVISELNGSSCRIVKEGLPTLLTKIPTHKLDSNKVNVGIDEIKGSRGGEYAVLQNGVLFVDG